MEQSGGCGLDVYKLCDAFLGLFDVRRKHCCDRVLTKSVLFCPGRNPKDPARPKRPVPGAPADPNDPDDEEEEDDEPKDKPGKAYIAHFKHWDYGSTSDQDEADQIEKVLAELSAAGDFGSGGMITSPPTPTATNFISCTHRNQNPGRGIYTASCVCDGSTFSEELNTAATPHNSCAFTQKPTSTAAIHTGFAATGQMHGLHTSWAKPAKLHEPVQLHA